MVVIGGGFAGLAAASALVKADRELSVLVLDAGDRLGGRVHTQEKSGLGKVEFGATYFHGVLDNPVWDNANTGGVEGLQPKAKGAFQPRKLEVTPLKYCDQARNSCMCTMCERVPYETLGRLLAMQQV